MTNKLLFIFNILLPFVISGQNILPEIIQKNVQFQGNVININFDATDADDLMLEIQIKIFSLDPASLHEEIIPIQVSGDIGYPVLQGVQKSIQVTIDPMLSHTKLRLLLKASDKAILDIQNLVDQVDSAQLIQSLNILQGRRNTTDRPFYDASRDYIFERLNSKTKAQRLTAQQPPLTIVNIEASQYGFQDPSKVIIVDAHYDSFGSSPGADDNASGIAGVLEAHRILSDYCSNKTIRYLAFDLEEAGLLGSLLYAANQLSKRETVQAVLNFEMIGFYTEEPNTQDLPTGFNILFPDAYNKVIQDQRKGNFITNVANTSSSTLKTIFDQNAAAYVPALRVISLEVPGNGSIAPDLRRSDHASFWDRGIPALMLTDGANFRNKKYHSASDSIHYLNFNFMSNVVKATLASLLQLGEFEHARCLEIPIQLSTSTHEKNNLKSTVSLINHSIHLVLNKPTFDATVTILNLFGQVIYKFKALDIQNQCTLPSPDLPEGSYFIWIQSGTEYSVSKLVAYD
ncbi:MAG: M28 family peptidase [Saprospiraceae bacterium]|nr:M28 family peptidase [Saprospiraceae bacterium]